MSKTHCKRINVGWFIARFLTHKNNNNEKDIASTDNAYSISQLIPPLFQSILSFSVHLIEMNECTGNSGAQQIQSY